MKSSQRKICSAVALAFSALGASAAMAQTTPTLQGGGSSLVAPSINAEIVQFGMSGDGTFKYFTANSSTGQTAFLTNNPALYDTTGVTVTGTIDFGNSDSALTGPQVTAYDTGTGLGVTDGPLIQLPYVSTPITIPLTNAPTGTGPTLTTKPGDTTPTVALNDNDLCGIFSGKIINWAGTPAVPGGAAATPGVVNPDSPTGATYTLSAPISVVYRSDGSGTTDLLTRHLHAVCTTGTTGNSNVAFAETQTFASNFASNTPPSNFIAESGSGNVAAELVTLRNNSTAAVSYLSPDYTNTLLAPSSSSATTDQLSVASLFNTHTSSDITPTAANVANALLGFPAPSGQSATSPAADPTQWVPDAADPTAGYPISGTTNIILSQCYANPTSTSPSPAAAVVDFLLDHYTSASFNTIITGNGFTTVPANFESALVSDFLSASTTRNPTTLNIGGAVCSTVSGR